MQQAVGGVGGAYSRYTSVLLDPHLDTACREKEEYEVGGDEEKKTMAR